MIVKSALPATSEEELTRSGFRSNLVLFFSFEDFSCEHQRFKTDSGIEDCQFESHQV
jgi:hypothetical protein